MLCEVKQCLSLLIFACNTCIKDEELAFHTFKASLFDCLTLCLERLQSMLDYTQSRASDNDVGEHFVCCIGTGVTES